MNFAPVLTAPLAIQIHLATIIPAFLIGTWMIFASRKGSTTHRAFGYLYLVLMTVTSISALFIHETNPTGPFGWSWIHLFVPLSLFGIVGALYGAWSHDLTAHRNSMLGVYFGGMMIAGGLSFMPGRIMHTIFFG
jgi:uncharacterized membrane protein